MTGLPASIVEPAICLDTSERCAARSLCRFESTFTRAAADLGELLPDVGVKPVGRPARGNGVSSSGTCSPISCDWTVEVDFAEKNR
jgi:hypothetical protein